MSPENKHTVFQPKPEEEAAVINERLAQAFDDYRSGKLSGEEYALLSDALSYSLENIARTQKGGKSRALGRTGLRAVFGRK